MPQVAQATILVTPVLEGAQQSLTEQLTGAAEPAAAAAGSAAGKSLGEGMSSAGSALTKGVTAPITAVGVAAVAAWKDVDAGLDTIVQKTGASGESLDEMHGILNNITSSIPTDFATAGAAIGEVNTRFGVTGQELEELSAQFVKFADLNGTDVSNSIDSVQAAMAAFGMDASDASDVLDIMNKVGQDTGVSMDSLARDLLANNAALQDAGLGFNEAANFLGNLNKNGVDSSSVMSGLRRAMANAAEEGKSTSEALTEIQDSLINAETDAEAAQIAMELFGTRSGASIAQMVRDGRISFDEFSGYVTDWGDSVSTTFDNTKGPMDEFIPVVNKLKASGSQLIEAFGPTLSTVLDQVSGVIDKITEAWSGLDPEMQETIIKIALIAAAAGPVLSIGGKIIGGISSITGSLGGLVGGLGGVGSAAASAGPSLESAGAGFVSAAAGALKIVAIAGSLVLVAVGIQMIVDAAIQIASAGTGAQIALAAIAGGILVLMGAAAALGGALTAGAVGIGVFGAAVLAIGAGIDLACDGISKVIDAVARLTETVSTNAEGINSVVSNVGDTVGGVITTISEGIATVIDAISGGLSGVLDSVAGVIDSIGNAALNAGTGFSTLADAVIRLTQQTSVMDLAATLGTVATKIKDINSAAAGSDNAANKIETIGTALKDLPSATSTASSAFSQLTNAATQGCSNILSAFQSMDIAGAMNTQMASAYTTASNWISQLQALFANTRFSFNQSLALPHFSMSGTFNAETGSVPSVSVSWYKKAAEYGALFSQPTIIGVGDAADPELLIGESKLQEMLGNNGNNVTFNVTVNGAESPEKWAARFLREAKQYERIS